MEEITKRDIETGLCVAPPRRPTGTSIYAVPDTLAADRGRKHEGSPRCHRESRRRLRAASRQRPATQGPQDVIGPEPARATSEACASDSTRILHLRNSMAPRTLVKLRALENLKRLRLFMHRWSD